MAKIDPIEEKTIQQLLAVGDKYAIIEWFRNKDKREAEAAQAAATQTIQVITEPCNCNQAQSATTSTSSKTESKWYSDSTFFLNRIINQMRVTDWILLIIAILLFVQIVKRK